MAIGAISFYRHRGTRQDRPGQGKCLYRRLYIAKIINDFKAKTGLS